MYTTYLCVLKQFLTWR